MQLTGTTTAISLPIPKAEKLAFILTRCNRNVHASAQIGHAADIIASQRLFEEPDAAVGYKM